MAHRPWHLFSGSGVLGLDLFGGGQPNIKPWLQDPSGKYGTGESMTDPQRILYGQDMADWEEMKNLREQRQAMFQEMSQKVGPTPSPYKSRMGTREAPPFFAQTAPVSRGPVDILAPEVETLDDIYRKRKNMFRMV